MSHIRTEEEEEYSYLVNLYKKGKNKTITCQCCGKDYETNINRLRCSEKCSKIMKFRRQKENKKLRL